MHIPRFAEHPCPQFTQITYILDNPRLRDTGAALPPHPWPLCTKLVPAPFVRHCTWHELFDTPHPRIVHGHSGPPYPDKLSDLHFSGRDIQGMRAGHGGPPVLSAVLSGLARASLPGAYEAGTTSTGVWPARRTRSVTLPSKNRLKPL